MQLNYTKSPKVSYVNLVIVVRTIPRCYQVTHLSKTRESDMKNFTTQHQQNNATSWFDFNSNTKKVAAIGAGLTLSSASLIFGLPVLYTTLGATMAGAYVLYPNEVEAWFEAHQTPLLGASLGFLHSGPIGLAIGGWLGHFVNKKVNQASERVHQVVETVKPVAAPFHYANQTVKGAWQKLKGAYSASTNWLFAEPEEVISLDNPRKPKDQAKKQDKKQLQAKPKTLAIMPRAPEVEPEAPANNGQIVLHREEVQVEKTSPTLLERAGDFFDLMNGQASDETMERYDDTLATKDVFDLASDALGSVKSNVSWLWGKVRGTQPAPEPVVQSPGSRLRASNSL